MTVGGAKWGLAREELGDQEFIPSLGVGQRPSDFLSDEKALALIAEVLDGTDWGADELDTIARIVRLTGRSIRDHDG
jgi:hypothetical protein